MRTTAQETAFQIAPKRWGGKVSVYVISVKQGIDAIKHIFLQEFSASLVKVTAGHEEQSSP